jgi:hypothetical protein
MQDCGSDRTQGGDRRLWTGRLAGRGRRVKGTATMAGIRTGYYGKLRHRLELCRCHRVLGRDGNLKGKEGLGVRWDRERRGITWLNSDFRLEPWRFQWRNREIENEELEAAQQILRSIIVYSIYRIYNLLQERVNFPRFGIKVIELVFKLEKKYEMNNKLHWDWWNKIDLIIRIMLWINFSPKVLGY